MRIFCNNVGSMVASVATTQYGRHIGTYHASAFTNTCYGIGNFVNSDLLAMPFWGGIGGHDTVGSL